MNRSYCLELSIDNIFTKQYWKLNEKTNIEVYRGITTVESIIACAPYCSKARLDLISTLLVYRNMQHTIMKSIASLHACNLGSQTNSK
jgi:hypothetical protein